MQRPFYHLSVDDVFESLVAASRTGGSLREGALFQALDWLHARHGVRLDLYLFWQGEHRGTVHSIDELSSSTLAELRARPWVRLGPHALDDATPPYLQTPDDAATTLDRLVRFVGKRVGKDACSNWVRLHYFSEPLELLDRLPALGIEAILTTDKPAIAYRLSPDQKEELSRRGRVTLNGIELVRSHLRVERLVGEGADHTSLAAAVDTARLRHGFVTIFTHERYLNEPIMRDTLASLVAICEERGLTCR